MASSTVKVDFISLGCPKNEADTNRMRALIEESGMSTTDQLDEADVVVVNTCSFLRAATEEGIDVIFDVLSDGGFNRNSGKLIVTGCMPSRYGEELTQSLPEVAGFLPFDHEDDIVDMVLALTADPLSDVAIREMYPVTSRPHRVLEGPSAYVKISDGCSRFCSFCTIPFIRGPYESKTFDQIDTEIASLVSQGAREIILIGQDTGIWGSDLDEGGDLAYLMGSLADRYPDTWFRVMYLQPEGIDDRLLQTFSSYANICDYLDIPLQHADGDIIADMNRQGSGREYLALIEHIRSILPDVALRTTLICGYPGETRKQAVTLMNFLEDARFDYAGVFAYSREDGTQAAQRTDQVPQRTKHARLQRLSDAIEEIGFAKAAERIGAVVDVLIEDYEVIDGKRFLLGRTMWQAPEVDGEVHITDTDARIGDVVEVRLTGSVCYELEGELI